SPTPSSGIAGRGWKSPRLRLDKQHSHSPRCGPMPQAADRVGRWLYLEPGEFGRAWPFFGLYLVLFAAFSVADGVALALFVDRVGAAALPYSYAAIAAANLLLIGGYVLLADRLGGPRTFAL